MQTTKPSTDSPRLTDSEFAQNSTTTPERRASSRSGRLSIDDASASTAGATLRVGIVIAAAVATLALAWTVATGPDTVVIDPSSHDQAESNRTATLRDLAQPSTASHDQAESNRTAALRDLAQPSA